MFLITCVSVRVETFQERQKKNKKTKKKRVLLIPVIKVSVLCNFENH